MDTCWRDIRYSVRGLVQRPRFTLTVVITLALGIGANATVFTWMKAVLLVSVPGVARPEQLVEVWGATRNNSALSNSYVDYEDLRDRTTVFTGLVAHQVLALNSSHGDRPERVWGAVVSGNYFDVLGVTPLIGRTFRPDEDRTPNTHPVIVLGYGFWQRRFGGDPHVLGQTITLNEHPFTVIGVAPKAFGSTYTGIALDLWTPVMMKDEVARPHFSLTDRGSRWLMVMGRLKPGVTVDQAQANVSGIAGQLARAYPDTNDQMGEAVYALTQSPFSLKQSMRPALTMLMAAVALVLLIACANVANLMLARATTRRKEIAVRLAIGGSRRRLVQQLLTESLVLAGVGAALGLAVAFWAARLFPAFLPPSGMSLTFDTQPDRLVLAFTVALAVITTLLCGLAPTLQASHVDVVTALKDTTASAGRGLRRVSLRHALVIAQVALSMVALIGAGLFVRSLRAASTANPGFDANRVLLASFDPFLRGSDERDGREFYRQLLARVRGLPGIESATLARRLPLTASGIAFVSVAIDGYAPRRDEDMRFNYETVGPAYFHTMRIPLVQGRDITDGDDERGQRVIVINETMARRFWPGGDAVGRRVRVADEWYGVVGVAKDVKNRSLSEGLAPFLYMPLLQDYRSNMILVARTEVEPGTMFHAVQALVAAIDAGMPLFDLKTLEEHVGAALFLQRMAATLLSVFGGLALVLAAVGLYGVMAYTVSQRVREVGIRMAIGAQRRDVLRLILGHGFALSVIGIAVGLIIAAAATRVTVRLLYGVSATDPITFMVVAVLLLIVGSVAGYLPARRATQIDPIVALRIE